MSSGEGHLENTIGHIPEGLLKDAMSTVLPVQGVGGGHPLNGSPMSSLTKPRLEIVEQPKSRGFRFRYDCEGQSHGGLPGENSEKHRKQKTYPTVRLIGYRGRARVMVSLVSDTDPPVPHAHSIVGKNSTDGMCIMEIGLESDMYAQFPNLGILHVTKKKVPEVLTQRLIKQMVIREKSLDHLETMPTDIQPNELAEIRQQAQQISKTMNLSVVRLCFQAFILDEHGRFTVPVDPVFSHKVYDSKAPSAGNLKICRLDRTSGSVRGGDDVFLLCDKVQKNDIEVLFYEEQHDSTMHSVQPWTAKGRFGPNDVHHQYAIVFQTPPFYNLAIERPMQVCISLRRPSDQEVSEPKPFLYLPQEFDEERIGAKRKKKLQHFNNFFGDGGAGLGGNFFKGLGDVGSFGFSNLFGSGGGGGGGGGGNVFGGGGGGSTNSATFGSLPAFDDFPSFDGSGSSYPSQPSNPLNMDSLSISGASYPSNEPQQPPYTYAPSMPTFGQASSQSMAHPMPAFRPHPQQVQQATYGAAQMGAGSYNPPHQGLYTVQQPYQTQFQARGGTRPQAGGGRGMSGIIGTGGFQPKREKLDPGYGDVDEMDGTASSKTPALKSQAPPDFTNLQVPMDTENEESGFAENTEQQDSGLPVADQHAEIEAQAAMQTLRDRQEAGYQVCERMFNALLAWATTRDVRYLLAAQRSLTAVQNQEGDTALHLAIIHNHQDVVLQLLDVLPQLPPSETPVVDCLNNFKQSPLHLAVLTRQVKVIQYLLRVNANPLVCDSNGNTPLHLASRMGFVQGAVAILNRTHHLSPSGCHIPELSIHNSNGLTPLHVAADSGNFEVLKQLCGARPDVDLLDAKSGKTALHYAVERGELPMTGFLVTEGDGNIDCCDSSGHTPLHVAAGQGSSSIVSLLIAAGANVDVRSAEGETPLQMAEYRKHEEVAKVLREVMQMQQTAVSSKSEGEDQLADRMESVSIKTEGEGDLARLDFRTRISLAMLLDPISEGRDWRELCRQLGLSELEPGLQFMTSPTKELLNLYEPFPLCGTVATVREILVKMNRIDAVNIIDRALMEDQGEPTLTMLAAKGATKPTPRPRIRTAPVFSTESVIPRSLLDSGLGGSQSTSEEMASHFGGTQLPPPDSDSSTYSPLATTQA